MTNELLSIAYINKLFSNVNKLVNMSVGIAI